jgi:transposase-like protein
MIDFTQFDSLVAMTLYFSNEQTCRQAVVETRWGVGKSQDVVCPYCGQHHCSTRKDGRFRCNHCKRNFSCKVGTIFEDSNLPLVKWFIAMYLISSHEKGETELMSYVHAATRPIKLVFGALAAPKFGIVLA